MKNPLQIQYVSPMTQGAVLYVYFSWNSKIVIFRDFLQLKTLTWSCLHVLVISKLIPDLSFCYSQFIDSIMVNLGRLHEINSGFCHNCKFLGGGGGGGGGEMIYFHFVFVEASRLIVCPISSQLSQFTCNLWYLTSIYEGVSYLNIFYENPKFEFLACF